MLKQITMGIILCLEAFLPVARKKKRDPPLEQTECFSRPHLLWLRRWLNSKNVTSTKRKTAFLLECSTERCEWFVDSRTIYEYGVPSSFLVGWCWEVCALDARGKTTTCVIIVFHNEPCCFTENSIKPSDTVFENFLQKNCQICHSQSFNSN